MAAKEIDKMVSEFMGNEILHDGISYYFFPKDPRQKSLRTVAQVNIFRTDANWLMLLLELVEHQLLNNSNFVVHRYFMGLLSINIKLERDRRFHYIDVNFKDFDTKAEAIYAACAAFVKWYNQDKN